MAIKIKTDYKKSRGFIYNRDYYRLEAIFISDKFVKHKKQILQKLEEVDFIVPANRHRNAPQMYELDKLIDELKVKGVDMIRIAINVLSDFRIESENFKEDDHSYFNYFQAILNKIFFNQSPQFEPSEFPDYKYDNEESPKELWVRIYPWSTKEVYESYYPFISILKAKLPNTVRKIKRWETFNRDLELYLLYKVVKENINRGILKQQATTSNPKRISKSPLIQMLYYPEFEAIQKQYGVIEFENLDKTIVQCKKTFGKLNLL